MLAREHLPGLAPCPFLPPVEAPVLASSMKTFGKHDRGAAFYEQALKCGQSLWLQGLPAQAMLQLNRAFGADLAGGEPVLARWPLPYTAMAWIMRERKEGQFIGNPRRHFQHLATRMVEPRRTQRAWRAWACWRLARRIFPDCPADEKQLAEEGVIEPASAEIVTGLERHGIPGEVADWKKALAWLETGDRDPGGLSN
ncbi:MAG: hypothetical protein H7A52_17910 [Akkermansiaceae bacterium]|nr:hypothetical protein [Akkermansiaceae bacterium]